MKSKKLFIISEISSMFPPLYLYLQYYLAVIFCQVEALPVWLLHILPAVPYLSQSDGIVARQCGGLAVLTGGEGDHLRGGGVHGRYARGDDLLAAVHGHSLPLHGARVLAERREGRLIYQQRHSLTRLILPIAVYRGFTRVKLRRKIY